MSLRHRCLAFRLRPGAGDDYDRRHRVVAPDLLNEIRAAGVTDSAVYRLGDTVFVLLVHSTDAATAHREISASEAARQWGARFADLVATEPEPLVAVWSLPPAEIDA